MLGGVCKGIVDVYCTVIFIVLCDIIIIGRSDGHKRNYCMYLVYVELSIYK